MAMGKATMQTSDPLPYRPARITLSVLLVEENV
jgi:hypothetical protein